MPFHFDNKRADRNQQKRPLLDSIRHLAAAAAVLAALPMPAIAQTVAYSTSPVSITSCRVSGDFAPGLAYADGAQGLAAGAQAFAAGDIALTFLNKGNVPATAVKFLVDDGASSQTVIDKGTFAPGVRIEHSFSARSVTGSSRTTNCTVAQVDFADGSAWHADGRGVAQR